MRPSCAFGSPSGERRTLEAVNRPVLRRPREPQPQTLLAEKPLSPSAVCGLRKPGLEGSPSGLSSSSASLHADIALAGA